MAVVRQMVFYLLKITMCLLLYYVETLKLVNTLVYSTQNVIVSFSFSEVIVRKKVDVVFNRVVIESVANLIIQTSMESAKIR